MDDAQLTIDIQQRTVPLRSSADLGPLLAAIGDRRVVLLGEASHGTKEFYEWRAHLSRRLIEEKGFSFVAVEGDWPDCFEVDRWVKGLAYGDIDARELLHVYRRWPTWMWANEEVASFITWLREHNQSIQTAHQVGWYGLDVYSLWESLELVMRYLETHDPDRLEHARAAFQCFEPFGRGMEGYASAILLVDASCQQEVVELLTALQQQLRGAGAGREYRFAAEQNALVAKNAEDLLPGDGAGS